MSKGSHSTTPWLRITRLPEVREVWLLSLVASVTTDAQPSSKAAAPQATLRVLRCSLTERRGDPGSSAESTRQESCSA